MSDFNIKDAVEQAANEALQDKDFMDTIKESIKTAIDKSIQSSFNYGALSKAIEKKIEEYLVPYIESYDMSAYASKLDDVLSELVISSPINDVSRSLRNFQTLMTVPEKKTIKLEDIFKAYCKYAAKTIDTDGRDVTCEYGAPEYESFVCSCTVEDITSEWSYYQKYSIDFTVEDGITSELDIEPMNFNIVLTRDKNRDIYSKDTSWSIQYDRDFNVSGLKNLSDFDVMLLTLVRAGVTIEDGTITDLEEDVTPEKEPEPTYE